MSDNNAEALTAHKLGGLHPSPALLRGVKAPDRLKVRRGFGLGERNPKTLPGSGSDAESVSENREASRRWSSLRKRVQAGARVKDPRL